MKKQISGGNYYSVEELAKDVFGDSGGRKIFCVYGEKSSLIRTRYV